MERQDRDWREHTGWNAFWVLADGPPPCPARLLDHRGFPTQPWARLPRPDQAVRLIDGP